MRGHRSAAVIVLALLLHLPGVAWGWSAAKTYTDDAAPVFTSFPAAGCDNVTPGLALDIPTSGGASKACLGTTTTLGVATFADAVTSAATARIELPADWTSTGGVDVKLYYSGALSSTNTIRWQVSTACVADNESVTAPSYNATTASNVAGPTTTPQRKSVTYTPAVTNCAASETLYVRIERIGGDGGDTYADTAYLVSVELTTRVGR